MSETSTGSSCGERVGTLVSSDGALARVAGRGRTGGGEAMSEFTDELLARRRGSG